MKIRLAILDDVSAIAVLATQLGYPTTAEQVYPRLSTLISDDQHAVFVGEDEHGKVCGWTHVHVVSSLYLDPVAELSGLVVDEDQRGRGVGRVLLGEAEHWAVEQGCSRLRVRSNVMRTRAHPFYTRKGYELVKTQKVFEKQIR